ncbi:MAG: relaxase domain-containing protein [Sphingopyxis sp.]|nr:relaxase domain-containing protein [Sphingopyxis sp.]
MVASVSALTSSAQASSYYEVDDYYAEGGLSPSEWQGAGAKTLGLSGEVDREQFRELLDGRIGEQQLGTFRDGQLEHRPGWDVTLSAPKSVSIMAEVAGDRRLIAAHGQAVKTAMAHVETHMAASIRFTRNDREAGRVNGGRGEVIAVDGQTRTAIIQTPGGKTETLHLDAARDRHIAHAYVETAFAAQGRTADHVIIHADSKATNLVDQKSFYVGISRAKETATIFTNDRGKLMSAINERAGQVQTAIAQVAIPMPAAARIMGAGLE